MIEIEIAEQAYQDAVRVMSDIHKQYLLAESEVIFCKIKLDRLRERDSYRRYNVVDTDDLRDQEIADFRLKHPELCGLK